MADTDWPITSVAVVTDLTKVPPGFIVIDKTYDKRQLADLWQDGLFGRRADRYMCVERCAPSSGRDVLVDVVIINERDAVPAGFICVDYTIDTREKAVKKKTLCIRMMASSMTSDAVSELILLSKGQRKSPMGYTLVGDLNNMVLCYKLSKITSPVQREEVQRSSPPINISIMASADVCDPCLESNNTVHAKKYCSECQEKLCAECTESHRRFRAFKSHHVIDLSLIGARIPPSSQINCEIHTDVQIDYFCSQHDVVCCRACIPDSHSSCKTVIPLDVASKDVKNSSLLSDMLKELDNMTETLEKMTENRDDNRKLLKQKKSLIIKQISTIKSKLLKHLDDIEERLITKVASVQEKSEEKIKREKEEICQLTSVLKDNKQELEFLQDHGSNNQLFLVLRKQITNIQKTENKIHDMTSAINEIDMAFEEIKNFTIGSVSQITRPCPIKYKSMQVQLPQVQLDRRKPLTEFIKEGQVNLKDGEQYNLLSMAVTSDNKLLLCNYQSSHPKVYIYKDYKTYEDEISFTSTSPPCYITVVPCTDNAVVTLPDEESIQFINTTNNTKDKKIKIGVRCGDVTAVKDKIYIDGNGKVLILHTDGSRVREITTDGGNFNLLYNERNDQLLLLQEGRLCCINLDGHVIYRYDISGGVGLAVDLQGHVYISGCDSNNIQTLSPDGTFRGIVLSEDNGVDRPCGITFNNDFTKLLIINGGETVLVYSCK